jgi:hypothetical protein
MLNPFAQSLLLDISPKNRGSSMRSEEKRLNTASTTRISHSGAVHIFGKKNKASNYLVTKSSLR